MFHCIKIVKSQRIFFVNLLFFEILFKFSKNIHWNEAFTIKTFYGLFWYQFVWFILFILIFNIYLNICLKNLAHKFNPWPVSKTKKKHFNFLKKKKKRSIWLIIEVIILNYWFNFKEQTPKQDNGKRNITK